MNAPKAPPISAPLVGILTLTMPQSDPFGLKVKENRTNDKHTPNANFGDHYYYNYYYYHHYYYATNPTWRQSLNWKRAIVSKGLAQWSKHRDHLRGAQEPSRRSTGTISRSTGTISGAQEPYRGAQEPSRGAQEPYRRSRIELSAFQGACSNRSATMSHNTIWFSD